MKATKSNSILLLLSFAAFLPCLRAYGPLHNGHDLLNKIHVRNATGSNQPQKVKNKKGACLATNSIDKCWRCQADWAENRERLADCVQGFGYNTTGGKGGKIYVVTDPSDHDLVDPKPGTLRYGVIQPGPLWIIFGSDMAINLQQELIMTCDKTIDGRGRNVRIVHGAGITIQFVNNIIIHNIHIHDIVQKGGGMIRDAADHVGMRGASDGDGINMFGSTNIWIDHVSAWRCDDGILDAVAGCTGVTISNCHFTKHNEVMLLGAHDTDERDKITKMTIAYNNFGKGLVQRMPACRKGFFHIVNNAYTHWGMYAIGGRAAPTILSQGNRYLASDNHILKQVTCRSGIPDHEWKTWDWVSEDDLFLNGAYFIPSGSGVIDTHQYSDRQIIKHLPGTMAAELTKDAGTLSCRKGKPC